MEISCSPPVCSHSKPTYRQPAAAITAAAAAAATAGKIKRLHERLVRVQLQPVRPLGQRVRADVATKASFKAERRHAVRGRQVRTLQGLVDSFLATKMTNGEIIF